LEDRVLPTTVNWVNPNSGNWDVGANWSTGSVPGAGDDVVINTTGAVTVTIQAGDYESVHSLTTAANDALSIAGGSLIVAANSTLSGGLAMTGGSLTASGSGTTLTAAGATNLATGDLFAEGGATLSLPQLTSYSPNGGYLRADGTGSVLDLSAVTTLAPTGYWDLYATDGGEVKLTGLTSLTGTQNINITDTGNSTLLDGNLATLSGVNVTLDGTDTQVANSWTSFTGGSLTVTGGSYTLSSLGDMDNSSVTVEGGATLSLPGVTSYQAPGNATLEASGAGSVLGLPNLTSFTDASYADTVEALSGGTVNLPGLTSLAADVNLEADGRSSMLNVPNLASFSVFLAEGLYFNSWAGGLSATQGGQIDAGSLTALTGATLTLSDTATISLGQVSDIDNCSVIAEGGATLSLPGVTSYQAPGNTTLEATGAGSMLDLPNLTTFTATPYSDTVEAVNGGTVNLLGLASLTADVNLEADGSGSVLNIPNLASFSVFTVNGGYINSGAGGLSATQGGQIDAGSLTALNAATLTLSDTATISLGQLSNIDNCSVIAEGGATLSLPGVTSYQAPGNTTLEATGAGSALDLPNLTTFTAASYPDTVEALGGGTVNLPGLVSLTAYVNLEADGSGSQVNLPALTSFTGGHGLFTSTSISAANGGTLSLPSLTTYSVSSVAINNGGTLDLGMTSMSIPSSGEGIIFNAPQLPTGVVLILSGGTYSGGITFNVASGADFQITGGTYSGATFNVASGATFDLSGGTYSGIFTGSGDGTVQFGGGTIGLGGLTLNFGGSMFQWTGGVINSGLGDITNLGTLVLSGTGDKEVWDDGTLDNFGTILQTGTGNLGLHSDGVTATTLKNEAGASYLIESDSGIDNPLGGAMAVINAGTIRKTAGTGTSTLYVNGTLTNTGTIEADSGTLYLDANTISQVSGSTLTGGTWNALNGATLEFPTGTAITSNEGNVTLGGSGATVTGVAGLASNSGSFALTGGADFTTAGDFTNSGSVTAGAGSTLTVAGNYTQTPTGTLDVQVGGTPASGQFGQVAVSGTATLACAFGVALVNDFSPVVGQVFGVMSFANAADTFTTFTGLSPFFTESLNPTSLALDVAVNAVDLLLNDVSAPITASAGQPITVNWQVTDQSSQDATGSWQDSVYLSATPAITSNSILLGSVAQTNGLAAGDSYNASLTATLPALAPGSYYVLVQADSLYQAPDPDRANNILAATTGPLDVSVPALTVGTPYSDAFTAADQDRYYQVTVPAGGTLVVALTSSASSGATALYVSQGTPPTPYDYQEAADVANQPNQTVTVPQVLTAGTYYVLAHSVSGAAATAGYILTVTQSTALTVSAPPTAYTGGNGGNVTVPILGTNFSPSTTASLTLGGTTINAASVYYQSAGEIYATFDLNGAAPGNYTLAAQDGSQTATAPGTFQVAPATTGNPVQLVLTPPAMVRSGRDGVIYVTATNTGNNDVLAPLLELTADGASLKLPSQSTFQGPLVYFLATSPTGPAGILAPGESVQVEVQFQSTTTAPTINFQLNQADDSQPMDWAGQQAALQLPSIPDAAWPIVYANFEAAVGSTVAGYHAVLAADATYLAQFGEPTNDVLQLVAFEIQKANAAYTAQTLVTVTADDLPAPGMDLTFQQSDLQSISGRYYQGILGQGWTTNWDISAITVPNGNAVIRMSGSDFYFVKQTDGSYQPEAGEEGQVLTFTNGAYQLVESNGTTYQFNTNGTLDYVQDANGNRITAGYNAQGQLSQLTDSNGEYLQLSYNAQGQLATLTDSTGQTETYGYTGALLTSYTDVYGTTTYSYVSGGTAAQDGALAEIAYADNTHIYFTYDSEGRLIDQHRDGGGEDEQFAYLTPGGYTETDGDGHTTTTYFDRYGGTVETIDGNGNATFYKYDSNLNLVEVDGPDGARYTYCYDANGNLLSETDPLNLTTQFTYNANNDLTSYTDARGDTTSYAYNGSNDLLSITYANGTQQQYSYNPLGEATQFLDARGQAIGRTYNAQGLVTEESFADGSSYTFTYDARGNMLTATDADGTITFTYTDPRNPSFLTKVTYPDGTYLEFTYNVVGQRTQSVDQTGFTVNYAYDALGRLSKLTDGGGNTVVQYTYDAAGNLVQKDNGNGTRTVYTYDADGNVLSITNLAPDHVMVNSFDDYTYDARGTVLTDTNQDGQWVYTYDADGQLTHAVFTPNGTDPDGLTAQDLQYVYDAAGNRISETVNGVVTTYVSNDVNEYTSSTTAGVGTTTYQYDADSNLISQTDAGGNTTTYTFNDLDQLTGVSGPGLTASYAYNPLSEMISQTVNGATTNYQIDPIGLWNTVAAFSGSGVYNNSGGPAAHYTYGLGLISQVVAGGTANYYDFDATGNTVGISDSLGAYVNSYTYLPLN
jgi:YD repeat-containing protein